MNPQEAIAYVQDVAAEELELADVGGIGMSGAVLQTLVGAVMRGEGFDSPEAVSRWLRQHTGSKLSAGR
jgi:hypothetical protein